MGSRHISPEKLRQDLEFFSSGLDLSKKQIAQVKEQLLEQVINHYLILEYGKENKISMAEGELQIALNEIKSNYTENAFKDALLRGYVDSHEWRERLKEQLLVEKIVATVSADITPPSYEEMKHYFEENQAEFTFSQMVKFAQIVTRTKQEAEGLLKKLKDGEPLSELARKHSIAPEAENGGEVGWVAKGDLDDVMEKNLFSLSRGEISDVIETGYGYHIFQVIDVRPEGTKTLPEVIGYIESKLTQKSQEQYLAKWLENLRTHFEVRISDNLFNNLDFSK